MYVANKNIEHNGKPYAKGSQVKESDPGFKDMLQAGHLESSDAKASPQAALDEGLKVSSEPEVVPEDKAEPEVKPKVFKKRK